MFQPNGRLPQINSVGSATIDRASNAPSIRVGCNEYSNFPLGSALVLVTGTKRLFMPRSDENNLSLLDLFKPREVRWTLRALQTCIWSGPSELYELRGPIAERCKHRIRNADKTCYSIRVDGYSPQSLALFIATDVTESLILSGQFHSYRGILSGEGHGLKRLLYHFYNLQLEAGILSSEELDQTKASIQEGISAIG